MQPSPTQLVRNMAIETAMSMFFTNATPKDFEIKNQLDALIDKALDNAPPDATVALAPRIYLVLIYR
jgi:hypothetical protein